MGKITKFTVKKTLRSPDMTVSKINLKDKYEDGEIDLSMCDLQEVPVKDIVSFKKAYSLDLSSNHIIQLPKNFTLLAHLTKLDVSKNQIQELPENFGELIKLRHLDLYRNCLKHLPLSFSKLKSLKWLDLKDNPLVPPIAEAAGPCLDNKQCQDCAKNIIVFYTQLQKQVEKEREMREKHRQQNLLMNEMAVKKQTQDKKSKKKHKKEKLDNSPSNKIKNVGNNINNSVDVKIDDKPKSHKNLTIVYTLSLIFIFIIGLFICTSLHLSYTENVDKSVRSLWYNVIDKLPQRLQDVAVQTGKHINQLHIFTGDRIGRLINIYVNK